MIYKKIFQLILCFIAVVSTVKAQNLETTPGMLTGTVKNQYGEPIAEAIVLSEYERVETITDEKGFFTISVNDGSAYVKIWTEGYRKATVLVNGKAADVRLEPDIYHLDDLIYDGFTTRTKLQTTGSVVTVSGEELNKFPTSSLVPKFIGQLPGLNTQQTGNSWADPGYDVNIRGAHVGGTQTPIVIIDGFQLINSPSSSLDFITPEEIESITVLKDAALLALYGIKSSRGAIIVNTKRGRPGSLKVTFSASRSMQEVTFKPWRANSATYATLNNQAAYNDNPSLGHYQRFTERSIQKFQSGLDKEHYPDNDWYDQYFNRWAYQERGALNFSGGSKRVHFYSNFNMMHQNTNYELDKDLEKYDPTPSVYWANVRSNVDVTLNNVFRVYLNIAANLQKVKEPKQGLEGIYSTLFTLPPYIYGMVTPEIRDPLTGEITHEGGKILDSRTGGTNFYGDFYRNGQNNWMQSNIYTNISVETDLSFITTGLKLTGSMGYLANNYSLISSNQNYEIWERYGDIAAYSDLTDELFFVRKGTAQDSYITYGKGTSLFYHLNYKGQLDYARTFGKHHVNALAYGMYTELTTGVPLRWKYIWSGVMANYNYDNRYLLTAGTGYSGSDQFAPGNRFHATPAVSAAWVLSNESFMKDVPLDILKIKGSWGLNGNDDNGMPRYPYINDITLSGERTIGDPNYSPEMVEKIDYGFEIGAKGLKLSVDMFDYHVDNLVVSNLATIPGYYGNLSSLPRVNASSFKSKGYEVMLDYNKIINKDWTVRANAWLSHSENEWVKYTDETIRDETYAYPKRYDGYAAGTQWGYLIDYSNGNGMINSAQELSDMQKRLSYSFATPRVGDLKYRDLNNDGIIDDKDVAPLNGGNLPKFMYGLTLAATYKNWDVTVLFQGVKRELTSIAGSWGINENVTAEGVYSSRHLKAWTEERYAAGEEILHPALSRLAGNANNQVSEFFMLDRSFMRLKNVEIGYTLPENTVKSLKLTKVRVTLSGYNLITWDKLDGYDYAPESGAYNSLPPFRVFNFGLNIVF